MKTKEQELNPERKENDKLEVYRLAVKDARHVFSTYKQAHPDEAWECLRKIIFNPHLK